MSRRKQRLSRAISKRQLIVEEFEPRAMLASLPVAVGESYDATQNRMLQIAAPGVLANDADADQDPLTAELVSDAQHGTVTMNPDGSFSYVPDLGYVGADSFTYRAVTLNPSTVFTVDRSLSSVNLDAILDTDFGRDSDDDSSSITGTITKRLSPNDAPFDEIHITDLDLVVADGLSLQFRFGFGLAGLNVDLPPDPSPNPQLEPLQIQMANAGDAAPVANGSFTQADNQLLLTGIIDIDATGLANGQIPEGPTEFNVTDAVTDLTGTAAQNGSIVTISAPLNFTGTFDASGNTIDVVVTGTIVARGEVVTEPEFSAPTTVTLDITDTTPPTVVDVLVNADNIDPVDLAKGEQPTSWQKQRSTIDSISVVFSEPIQGPLLTQVVLTNLGIDADDDDDTQIVLSPFDSTVDGNVFEMRFPGNRLPEGVYKLEVSPVITDLLGLPLDGNQDGTGGDPFVYEGNDTNKFFRLEADWSGDAGISVFDFSTFSYWFGEGIPDAPKYVDLNDDDGVSVFDFSGFSANFGVGVVFADALQLRVDFPRDMNAVTAPIEEVVDRQTTRPLFDWLRPDRRTDTDVSTLDRILRQGELLADDADLEEVLVDEIAAIWQREMIGLREI